MSIAALRASTGLLSSPIRRSTWSSAGCSTPAPVAEQGDAGDQGEDVAPPAAGSPLFWGRHLWARGYFVCSSGNVTDEVIAHYIKHQDAEPQDDDRFQVTE